MFRKRNNKLYEWPLFTTLILCSFCHKLYTSSFVFWWAWKLMQTASNHVTNDWLCICFRVLTCLESAWTAPDKFIPWASCSSMDWLLTRISKLYLLIYLRNLIYVEQRIEIFQFPHMKRVPRDECSQSILIKSMLN